MSLRSELVTLEESLSISSPTSIRKPLVFLSVPDLNESLVKQQAVFENTPFAPREVGQMGDRQELIETIRVRFSAYDADFDRAIEIADAFKAVFINALAWQRPSGRRLNDTFAWVDMRDSDEPFESFNGRPGWELLCDFTYFRDVVAV